MKTDSHTAVLLAWAREIEARHQPNMNATVDGKPLCFACLAIYPCDAAQLAHAVQVMAEALEDAVGAIDQAEINTVMGDKSSTYYGLGIIKRNLQAALTRAAEREATT